MVSKATIKFIKSLKIKKYRVAEQRFVVEGVTSVMELLNSDFEIQTILATEEFISNNQLSRNQFPFELLAASVAQIESVGTYRSNNGALAVVKMKLNRPPSVSKNEFVLMLDSLSDPGNLGTIIRTADWFGIQKIICSLDTAEFYNPKVIQATMGSFTRIHMYYTSLVDYLQGTSSRVYGTFVRGEDINKVRFGENGVVLVGNEAKGISPELESYVEVKVTIPSYGEAESLNVAVATGIVLQNIRKN